MSEVRVWLTENRKEESLKHFSSYIEKGKIDLEFLNYLKIINEISGVRTIGCCTGHGRRSGYLELDMSKEMWDYFHKDEIVFEILNTGKPAQVLIKDMFGLSLKKHIWGSVFISFHHSLFDEVVNKVIEILKEF